MNAIYSALCRLTSPLAVAAVLAFVVSVADRLIGFPESVAQATLCAWVVSLVALIAAFVAERLADRTA